MKKNKDILFDGIGNAYLTIQQAAVIVSDSRNMFAKPDAEPTIIKDTKEKDYKMVPWGEANDLPNQIISKVGKSHDMSRNLLFNIECAYGDGVMAVVKTWDETTKDFQYKPITDNAAINEFFENNDISLYLLEQLNDMFYFYNTFPEIILSRDENAETRKVVTLTSKEATFSRWSVMNKEGQIEKHLYSSRWVDPQPDQLDIIATDVLNPRNSILDLKRRMGREPRTENGKTKDDKVFSYIVPVTFPVPGRFYYQKPQWYSLIESGWYDFALLIPEFKRALLNNQMTIKYMIYINEKYFPAIFAEEGITTLVEKKKRIAKEYDEIKKFLSGAKNSGKASFSKIRYTPDGKEEPMVKIVPLENHFKGGEYIEDSEEVSNILAYGMGVHASLIGSHGKAGTISGSEARELFLIKQSMMKPIRDRILKPFYLIKAINKWPANVEFIIRNTKLTTLDQGTGATKQVGSPVN
ncbi:MAG: hypothetical protein WCK02_02040 [Bacteroidota bacterium]